MVECIKKYVPVNTKNQCNKIAVRYSATFDYYFFLPGKCSYKKEHGEKEAWQTQQLTSDLKCSRSLVNIPSNIFLLLVEEKLQLLGRRLISVSIYMAHVIVLKSSEVLVLQFNTDKQCCLWASHFFFGGGGSLKNEDLHNYF